MIPPGFDPWVWVDIAVLGVGVRTSLFPIERLAKPSSQPFDPVPFLMDWNPGKESRFEGFLVTCCCCCCCCCCSMAICCCC